MVSFAEWSVNVPHCRSFTISHSAVVIAEQRGSAIAFLGVVRLFWLKRYCGKATSRRSASA